MHRLRTRVGTITTWSYFKHDYIRIIPFLEIQNYTKVYESEEMVEKGYRKLS